MILEDEKKPGAAEGDQEPRDNASAHQLGSPNPMKAPRSEVELRFAYR